VGVRALRFDFSVSCPMESEPARVAGAARKRLGVKALAFEPPALFGWMVKLRATTQPVKGTV
jgi:hypothetical protein